MNNIAMPLLDVATAPIIITFGVAALLAVIVVADVVFVTVYIIRFIIRNKNAKSQVNTKGETL